MNPVGKALWFIESTLGAVPSLSDIARFSGVSPFHLTRAFGAATGYSVMRYVRGRRLSTAARDLAAGAPDILTIALDAGYGSHEAFTRAFRDQFGLTPEALRAQRSVNKVNLMEPITMDETLTVDSEPPRFEKGSTLLVAGIGERYRFETNQAIPQQWQRFLAQIDDIPGRVGRTAYGVCCNADAEGHFDYVAGIEVSNFDDLPSDLARVRIPEGRYVVFSHRDHISTIRATHHTIWNQWLPASGHEVADTPSFERYDEGFDAQTGTGTVEIWLPLSL